MKTKKYIVGVSTNSTDYGTIGEADTIPGALRIGRRWARWNCLAWEGPTIIIRDNTTTQDVVEERR